MTLDTSRLPLGKRRAVPPSDAGPHEANGPNPARCVVSLRPRICYLLAVMRIHNPDCGHCSARGTCGNEMLKRLEDLNSRMRPSSLKNEAHGEEVVEDGDSKLPKL